MDRYMHQQQNAENKKVKFYNHLRTYLCFIGFMFFAKFFFHVDANFYPVAFWWGFGVVVHYLRTFGVEGLTDRSAAQEAQSPTYETFSKPDVEEFVELKQPQKSWRDRDLV